MKKVTISNVYIRNIDDVDVVTDIDDPFWSRFDTSFVPFLLIVPRYV